MITICYLLSFGGKLSVFGKNLKPSKNYFEFLILCYQKKYIHVLTCYKLYATPTADAAWTSYPSASSVDVARRAAASQEAEAVAALDS